MYKIEYLSPKYNCLRLWIKYLHPKLCFLPIERAFHNFLPPFLKR